MSTAFDPAPVVAPHRQDFQERGYAVVENVFPDGLAEEARGIFMGAEYDHVFQERKQHYTHVFNTQFPDLPKPGEVYYASFWRSVFLEKGAFVQGLYQSHIQPLLEAFSGSSHAKVDLRAYRLTRDDLFRTHIDDYAGNIGFIYYMSKGWKWDWGGILTMLDGDKIIPTLPRFNQIVVINHKHFRPPHFVSPVAHYAQEPRYMLVGFAQ
jgi:Rps23 Pro-64 3,4-dihydroxylase Tpa1-like proline 4-hydroxylase